MANIEEITADTDLSSLMNVGTVNSTLEDININTYTSQTVDVLGRQMNSGGALDEYSINIGGKPILFEKAQETVAELQRNIDDIETYKNNLIKSAEEHRKEELSVLHSKVEQKIASLESEKNTYKNALNGTSNTPSQYRSYETSTYGKNAIQLQNEIDSLDGQIKTYNEKLTAIENDEYYRG